MASLKELLGLFRSKGQAAIAFIRVSAVGQVRIAVPEAD